MSKLLTIGMATYDDFDGVYFTIQSLRLHHALCNTDQVEYVVLDGNPTGEHGKTVKEFVTNGVGRLGKYIPYQKEISSSFDKYAIATHAQGKYVLILDCHILLKQKAIDYLLKYYELNPDCKDLVQGPLLYDDLTNISTHFDKNWSGHMYGTWGHDLEKYKKGDPFEIPMNGMGLCSFERKNWPGISQHFRGFGGEEGYIAEKFRKNGGKNICIPHLAWNHRFGRPSGVKYRLILEDRVWNYFIGWLDIYKDPNHPMIHSIYDYFKDKIPEGVIDNIFNEAKKTIL